MKACSLAVLVALLCLTSCARRTYPESELRSLLVGSWNTSSLFETNTPATRIELKSIGKTAFNSDGTITSESDTLMRVRLTEGELPVEYHAVVHGNWSVSGQRLHMSRTSEKVTAKDEISRKFIESEGMKQLRSESPTEFVHTLTISPGKIVALDAYGERTTYTREK
jgi:hypothetical protein